MNLTLHRWLSRLHDLRGGAAVCRVGPLLRHAPLPDHAGSHGAEQGQLGRPAAGSNLRLGGGGAWCRQRGRGGGWREWLQRYTSGKQRVLTVGSIGASTHTHTHSWPLLHTRNLMFCCLLPPILINHWFLFNLFNFFFFWHRAIHRYLILATSICSFCPFLSALFYLFVHCSFFFFFWLKHTTFVCSLSLFLNLGETFGGKSLPNWIYFFWYFEVPFKGKETHTQKHLKSDRSWNETSGVFRPLETFK